LGTLLDAIAALRSGKTPSVEATTTSSAPSTHPEDRAERHQVTVMFSDLPLFGEAALAHIPYHFRQSVDRTE
jgi:hypothetical protein